MIGIGIDTGGTYTDAVAYDFEKGDVIASAKRLTTKHDLAEGIGAALDALPVSAVRAAAFVSLSTTLATNACVEGKGCRAKLVVAGLNEASIERAAHEGRYGFAASDVLALDAAGTFDGSVVVEPDWEEAARAREGFFEDADAFGIAALYALNNGGVVERHGAEFLERRFGKLVVQACDVAGEINVLERGATALLNARLIPLVKQFVAAMRRVLDERGLELPLRIIRSDGSLMSCELAEVRPVETILSGPAASVCGGQGFAESRDALVIDMGGTTTDVSVVRAGEPIVADGVRIGGWRTQVKGVFVDTIGLGGDSAVRRDETGRLFLSPERVEPLCVAAAKWPQIAEELERVGLRSAPGKLLPAHEFCYLAREPEDPSRLSEKERCVVGMLADGPLSLSEPQIVYYRKDLQRLEREGMVMRVGVTPTDAMHVKGDFAAFDARASRLGMRALLRRCDKDAPGAEEALANEIYELVEEKLFATIVRVELQQRYPKLFGGGLDGQISELISRTWRERAAAEGASLRLAFACRDALVGLGAPARLFLPAVAEALGAECIIPPHAEVANALGVARSRVRFSQTVRVVPVRAGDGITAAWRVHGQGMVQDCPTQDEALDAARKELADRCQAIARERGAGDDVHIEIDDPVFFSFESIGDHVTTEITITAHAVG